MRSRLLQAAVVLVLGAYSALAQSPLCSPNPKIVLILKGVNDTPQAVMSAVQTPDTWVLMEPDIDIDFSNVENPAGSEDPLISLARCVTLASFQRQGVVIENAQGGQDGAVGSAKAAPKSATHIAATAAVAASPVVTGAIGLGNGNQLIPGSGRTPGLPGPVLRYGTDKNRSPNASFIQIACGVDNTAPSSSEGARILGFRVFGPNFNDHQTSEIGINIVGCYNEEVGNMEVAGWGGSAVRVDDNVHFSDKNPVTKAPVNITVLIHDNYIHHNQHSTSGGHALGYGVVVSDGAFAEIDRNVFDYNRHSVTASGNAGGYNALRNLLLKGGGFHNGTFERDIHIMDVHGTASCSTTGWDAAGAAGGALIGAGIGSFFGPIGSLVGGIVGGILGWFGVDEGVSSDPTLFNCGDAGFQFAMDENTFQYTKTTDLKLRGKPRNQAVISDNVFARSSKDDAIVLQTQDNVSIKGSNVYNDDTFGAYGVCDIDGDGIDDLILMTGVTWWFSSSGIYPWSYLKFDPAVLKDVKLGDFDGDGRCDVLKDAGNGNWMISSGAKADWTAFGNYLAPLNVVAFGRFDPKSPDFNRGIRPPTHAFWRGDPGNWFVTPLSQPGGWTLTQTSGFPFSDLRFGDFTGDGVTDVLANEGGHWAISESARGGWRNLNPTLNDAVKNSNIFIGNMESTDNIDDVLRFDLGVKTNANQLFHSYPITVTYTATWNLSSNGTSPWSSWKTYTFAFDDTYSEDFVGMGPAFLGQFRGAPGLATLTIDENRIGHFYSPAQGKDRQEWQSLFAY